MRLRKQKKTETFYRTERRIKTQVWWEKTKSRINFLLLITGDSGQQHRREISGYVNNHRTVPSMTSNTPPRRSSIPEQRIISVAKRFSLNKQNLMINNVDMNSPAKR